MESEEMKQKETDKIFGRRNYLVLGVGTILIIVGYILMSGEESTLAAYHPDIFSGLRIRVAPIICLTGYLLNAFGVIYRKL